MKQSFRIAIIAALVMFVAVAAFRASSYTTVSTPPDTSTYKLVFSDEFNLPDGSQPDSTKWRRCIRYNSLWNKWVSNSKDVVFIKNGKLICKAIPNRTEKTDTAQMLTGAIETLNKFNFTYGKIEARMRTNNKKGNFPAIWTRNVTKSTTDPYSEIDVVEIFGKQKKSFHTAHTQYTITTARHKEKNSFNKNLNPTKWHVYGLIWTPDMLIWTVDGEEVGRYHKSNDQGLRQKGQWTFNSPHYIRINQSVGDGVHGMVQDVNTTYTTEIDWIRVYQPSV